MSPGADDEVTLTLAEYLTFELPQEQRHELVNGHAVPVAGASERHDLLVNLINIRLATGLLGRCRVFPHNRKLVCPTGNVRYPDILVHCGRRADKHFEDDARVLVEVRSPSNTARVLDEKLDDYRALPSLEQVLVLDPDRPDVALYERHDLGWSHRWVEGTITVAGVEVDLVDLYRQVEAQATGD